MAVVNRPALAPRTQIRAIGISRDPKTGARVETVIPEDYDNAFGPAARRVLLRTPFVPAVRGDRPVASTLRMTVRFGAPKTRPVQL